MMRILTFSSAAAALLGGALTALGWIHQPVQAAHSVLCAFGYVFTLSAGSLALLMMGHATRSGWFALFRRQCEWAVAALPAAAIAFVAVLASVNRLYPWARAEHRAESEALSAPAALSLDFKSFAIRGAVYFGVLIVFGELLRTWSLKQELGNKERLSRRMTLTSTGGLPLVALALTFAAFDWFMSLEADWYSTIYGVYVFCGAVQAALGLVALTSFLALKSGPIKDAISPEHFSALGRLLLAFTILWTYTGYAELLLIWIADQPQEVRHFLARWGGGWAGFGILLVFGRFVVPFALLLSKRFKRNGARLGALGGWVLIAAFVDWYWLVLPALHPRALTPSWLDFTALLALAGFCTFVATLRARRTTALASGAPELEGALGYQQP